MSKKVFSKLIWRWKHYLVTPSCSSWAWVSGGQSHTQKHTQRKAQRVPQRALQSGSIRSLSVFYNLAQGTSNYPCLLKWAGLKEPATQKHHIQFSYFIMLPVEPQDLGLGRNSLQQNKTTRFFSSHEDKTRFWFIFLFGFFWWKASRGAQPALGNVPYSHSTQDLKAARFTVYGF